MRTIKRALPRRARRRFRGTELLELGLVLGLILLPLTFGMIEGGFYFYLEQNVQGAAREGARAAIPGSVTDGERDGVAKDAVDRVMSDAKFKGKDGGDLAYDVDSGM